MAGNDEKDDDKISDFTEPTKYDSLNCLKVLSPPEETIAVVDFKAIEAVVREMQVEDFSDLARPEEKYSRGETDNNFLNSNVFMIPDNVKLDTHDYSESTFLTSIDKNVSETKIPVIVEKAERGEDAVEDQAQIEKDIFIYGHGMDSPDETDKDAKNPLYERIAEEESKEECSEDVKNNTFPIRDDNFLGSVKDAKISSDENEMFDEVSRKKADSNNFKDDLTNNYGKYSKNPPAETTKVKKGEIVKNDIQDEYVKVAPQFTVTTNLTNDMLEKIETSLSESDLVLSEPGGRSVRGGVNGGGLRESQRSTSAPLLVNFMDTINIGEDSIGDLTHWTEGSKELSEQSRAQEFGSVTGVTDLVFVKEPDSEPNLAMIDSDCLESSLCQIIKSKTSFKDHHTPASIEEWTANSFPSSSIEIKDGSSGRPGAAVQNVGRLDIEKIRGNQTPLTKPFHSIHRQNLVSPFTPKSKVKFEEAERFNAAVHTWSLHRKGGVAYLHKNSLVEEDFKDLLEYCGPGSSLNILEGYSIDFLRGLWRNSTSEKDRFRGHPDTGYENSQHLHETSEMFCPFMFCETGLSPKLFTLPQRDTAEVPHFHPRKLLFDASGPNSENVSESNNLQKDFVLPLSIEEIPHENSGKIAEVFITSSKQANNIVSCITQMKSNDVEVVPNLLRSEPLKDKDAQSSVQTFSEIIFKCPNQDCKSSFDSVWGLERHMLTYHPDMKEKLVWTCPICNKTDIRYLDDHISRVHSVSVVKSRSCPICKADFPTKKAYDKHRSMCTSCPHAPCDITHGRLDRLLNHMKKCPFKNLKIPETSVPSQQTPLDLTSPYKVINHENSKFPTGSIAPLTHVEIDMNKNQDSSSKMKDVREDRESEKFLGDAVEESVSDLHTLGLNDEENLKRVRTQFSFESDGNSEKYSSEYEDDDTPDFTVFRRRNKDWVERELRKIDQLKSPYKEGDDFIVMEFENFMKKNLTSEEQPSTINMYSRHVRNDILASFHRLYPDMDARDLLDKGKVKTYLVDGNHDDDFNATDPCFFTVDVLVEVLKKYESGCFAGALKTALAAVKRFMSYVENHFTLNHKICGLTLLKRILDIHKIVTKFITNNKTWGKAKHDEISLLETNKLIESYDAPNKNHIIMEKFKAYLESESRLNNLKLLVDLSKKNVDAPTPEVFNSLGRFAMEEGHMVSGMWNTIMILLYIKYYSGCRPKVLYHMRVSHWTDRVRGFNPIDDSIEDDTDFHRLNPNRPPKVSLVQYSYFKPIIILKFNFVFIVFKYDLPRHVPVLTSGKIRVLRVGRDVQWNASQMVAICTLCGKLIKVVQIHHTAA